MKFKIDENLPVEIAVGLRNAGHDAMTVVDQGGCSPAVQRNRLTCPSCFRSKCVQPRQTGRPPGTSGEVRSDLPFRSL